MKIAVSIPDKLFRSADSLAKRLGISRSQLYATALADFLSRRQSQQVKERLDAIYGEEESLLDRDIMKLQIESLPPEEW
jgi:metal-responsive CopG/Arc/MetJ family transcriptional regulator